jgi:xanthine/uracil/vitamin C permease (AzgA family)
MKTSMITATAAITIISTFVMAVFANLPLVVAPGLGALSPPNCLVFTGCCATGQLRAWWHR